MGRVQLPESDSFWLYRMKRFCFKLNGVGLVVLEFLAIVFDDDEGILIHVNDKILVE
jgi:hypothetical protein